jgi:hypothetical protein
MGKPLESPLKRINRVMKYLLLRGINSERVNKLYRKIINQRLKFKIQQAKIVGFN